MLAMEVAVVEAEVVVTAVEGLVVEVERAG